MRDCWSVRCWRRQLLWSLSCIRCCWHHLPWSNPFWKELRRVAVPYGPQHRAFVIVGSFTPLLGCGGNPSLTTPRIRMTQQSFGVVRVHVVVDWRRWLWFKRPFLTASHNCHLDCAQEAWEHFWKGSPPAILTAGHNAWWAHGFLRSYSMTMGTTTYNSEKSFRGLPFDLCFTWYRSLRGRNAVLLPDCCNCSSKQQAFR